MKAASPITLPQLPNDIVTKARKTRLCSYSVALEGWRRGLKLKWYTRDSEHFQDMIISGVNPPGRLFSLSSDGRTRYSFRTRGDRGAHEAVELGSDRHLTTDMLEKEGARVPKGNGFDQSATAEYVINYGLELAFPLVLKPTDGSLGLGPVTS